VTTSGITGALNAQNSTDAGNDQNTKKAGSSLGQDAFLRLLTTQLEHQDPLQPKEDGEFLAQLAQFSSLEKLSEISSSIQDLAKYIKDQQQAQTSPATSADSTTTGGK
jgi:flagellar basal-body rod modification protein FlgD